MFVALEVFGAGILLGAGLALAVLHLRPTRGAAPLSLLGRPNTGTDAVTAQVPPQNAYPYEPFYPSPEDEVRLGHAKGENAPSHEPMEARRR